MVVRDESDGPSIAGGPVIGCGAVDGDAEGEVGGEIEPGGDEGSAVNMGPNMGV